MKNGGTGLNASTSYEVTGYYVTHPSNKIELQMLLESDRIQNAYLRTIQGKTRSGYQDAGPGEELHHH